MSRSSFIYSNIRYYRFIMGLLYGGKYRGRYKAVTAYIQGKKVTELCFGDTVIAGFCRRNNIEWTGFDINEAFVDSALKKGFNAKLTDVAAVENILAADTCIISGSLYHFHDRLEPLLRKILASAPLLIISEPVRNLSDNNGIIGKLAKASATVEGKAQHFRYTDKTLKETLDDLGKKLGFRVEVKERFSKDRIILVRR
ncbi:MAG: hypothetical protein ACJ77K_15450 [Bacteroidia bacterium]